MVRVPLHCSPRCLLLTHSFTEDFEEIFSQRICEGDQFWNKIIPATLTAEEKMVARQAAAGLLWTKQFYHYSVKDWLEGDPDMPAPPAQRLNGRNADWPHLFNRDVISMPDKWEYPWFATWDLAYVNIILLRFFLTTPVSHPFNVRITGSIWCPFRTLIPTLPKTS